MEAINKFDYQISIPEVMERLGVKLFDKSTRHLWNVPG